LKSREEKSLGWAQEQRFARERDTNIESGREFATGAGGWEGEFDTSCVSCCS